MDRNAIRYRGQGIMNENKVKWHPYPQEKPLKEGRYLVTFKHIFRNFVIIRSYPNSDWDKEVVIAWAELPKPYDKRRTRDVKVKWHPYPEEKPSELTGDYLVTEICEKKRDITIDWYINPKKQFFDEDKRVSVVAWAELPEPYKENKNI